MPELPEVETTARRVAPDLIGRTVSDVSVRWKRSIVGNHLAFKKNLIGKTFQHIGRRAKFIVFDLNHKSKSWTMLCHLRMSGSLDVFEKQTPRVKHDRVIISLDDGNELRFFDIRKFGKMYLAEDPSAWLAHLGPEPLDRSFSSAKFCQMLSQKKGAIKPLLLNQSFIAGLGNIYVDEALWKAKIHPLDKACNITNAQACQLHNAIRRILRKAIKNQGTDAGDGIVIDGDYTPLVYGREGEKCKRCNNLISRIVVGQRGTHFCPKCQRV